LRLRNAAAYHLKLPNRVIYVRFQLHGIAVSLLGENLAKSLPLRPYTLQNNSAFIKASLFLLQVFFQFLQSLFSSLQFGSRG